MSRGHAANYPLPLLCNVFASARASELEGAPQAAREGKGEGEDKVAQARSQRRSTLSTNSEAEGDTRVISRALERRLLLFYVFCLCETKQRECARARDHVTDGFGEKELANHSAIPSPVVIRATQDLVTFLRGVSLTPELCPQ